MLKFFIFLFIINFISDVTFAKEIGSATGFKIPRYVSIKSNEANLRVGSSINYPIILTYIIKNFPIEIIEEFETWRKIKDVDGNIGWIHKSLLKGDRYAIIQKKNFKIKIYSQPNFNQIAEIGSNNIVKVYSCLIDWCKIQKNKIKGWIYKSNLWGVYKDEIINVPIYQTLINQYWNLIKFFFHSA